LKTALHNVVRLLFLAGVLGSSGFSAPQRSIEQDEPVRLSTQLVVVDAQVLSKKTGTPVNGLTERDFVISEEGVKQQITHFSQDRLPLSIVLLLDVSGSVTEVIDQVRDSGLTALNELKPGDEVALMAFGAWATVLQGFTRDRRLLSAQVSFIESMGPWIRAGTYIDEAVYEASKYLANASNPHSRRIIVIVTDNLANQPPKLGHSDAQAMRQLHAAGAVFCGLIVGDFDAATNEYKSRGLLLTNSLRNFVAETGGILLQVDKDDVTAKLARLIERLRSRYSLGYTPLILKRDGKFREIKLRLMPHVERREGEVIIVSRKGYVAPKAN